MECVYCGQCIDTINESEYEFDFIGEIWHTHCMDEEMKLREEYEWKSKNYE
ncbi:hypothetical protein SFC08_13235 [Lysinibacillus halotolerans]